MGVDHRLGSTAERLYTVHPTLGTPLDPGVLRHNAYVVGFVDAASDAFGWDDYGHGVKVGGQDYVDGFAAGKAAREVAFKAAQKRQKKPVAGRP